MRPKEYLSRIKLLDVLIEQKIKERDDLKKYDLAGINYDRERVAESPSGESPQARLVEKLLTCEAEINAMIAEFYDTKSLIIKQIQSLQKAEYVQLLFKRYVEFKPLEDIAKEMNYDYGYIRSMHGYALEEFKRNFPDVF